ncbi:MAG: hypothetical protein ACTHN5_08030 [Phycisphaerae bacterium]
MTDPSLQPAVLAYRSSDDVALRHPRTAIVGFLLFGLWFLDTFSIVALRLIPARSVFVLYRIFSICQEVLLLVGALLIIHAFRGSPLARPRFRLAMLGAIATQGITFGAVQAFWIFGPALRHRAQTLYTLLMLFENAAFILFLAILLILLLRAGRAMQSRPFRLLALLALGAEILLTLLATVVSQLVILGLLDPAYPLLHLYIASLNISQLATKTLAFALFLWCAIATRRLSTPGSSAPP